MIELVYPQSPAPVSGPEAAADEMLPVVRATGEVVGRASRQYLHSGVKLMHPVVHMHIIDRYSRLCLQLRGRKQRSHPGKWDVAVGGHVGYGEMCEEALFRESREELGLYDFNPIYLDSYVYENENQLELVNVYAAVGSFELRPDQNEVQKSKYWTFDEIREKSGKGIFTPVLEREFANYCGKLEALL